MKYIGIHLEGDRFLVAVLNRKLNPLFLSSFPTNKKFTLGKKFLLQQKRFIAGLEANNVLIKETSLKIKGRSVIEKALFLRTNTLFPFENKPSVVIPILKNKSKGQQNYLLYGTTVSKIKKYISDFEEKNIPLNILSVESAALARFANTYFPPYKLSFIINIGENKTICVFLEDGYPIFSHTIRIGKNDLFQDLDPENPFDLELIDESKKDAISTKWVQFKTLIAQTFLSIKREEKIFLLLTGNLENAINIENFLFSAFKEDILFYGKENILNHDYKVMRKYAISIGYCIDAIKNDKKSLQFIQKDCLPKKSIFTFYKKTFYLTFLAICFSLASLKFQSSHANIKSRAISQKFEVLKEFDEKQMKRSIDLSNSDTLLSKMDAFHDAVSQECSFFPYLFKKLKPTDVLAIIFKKANNLQIKNFQYKIESHPTIKKPYDKTAIKVVLTLNGNSNDINHFKNTLLNESFISQKTQIKHTFEGNIHKISFYLK